MIFTWQFKKVQLQGTCDNGHLIPIQDLTWNGLAGVNGVAKVMGGRQRNVDKPDTSPSFVALEIRIV